MMNERRSSTTLTRLTLWLVLLLLFTGGALQAHTDSSHAEVETLARSTHSWDGATLPAYPQGQPEVTLLRITIPPKVQLPLHHHPFINVGLLLSGTLDVIDEKGNTLTLKAGESLVELVETPHYGRNPGDEPAVIVVFYVGIKGEPVTVLEKKQP